MRKSRWIAWMLITAMSINHVIPAYASVDLQTWRGSDSGAAKASASDAEPEPEWTENDLEYDLETDADDRNEEQEYDVASKADADEDLEDDLEKNLEEDLETDEATPSEATPAEAEPDEEELFFADRNLLKALCERGYDRNGDGMITLSELDEITELDLSGADIYDLTGIEYAQSLQMLDISDNNITDLEPLSDCGNLQYLYARNNQLTDIPPFDMWNMDLQLYEWDEDGQRYPLDMFSGNGLIYHDLWQVMDNLYAEDDWYAVNACDWEGLWIPKISDAYGTDYEMGDDIVAGIHIEWYGQDGVDGYYVYRKTVGADWEEIARIETSEAEYWYDDTSVRDRIYYTYTIASFRTTDGVLEVSDYDPVGVSVIMIGTYGEFWVDTDEGRQFFRQGQPVFDEFVEYEGELYYLNTAGYMHTGWLKVLDDDGNLAGWMHFKSDGTARRRRVFKLNTINNKQYAFDEDGFMLCGWASSAENRSLTDPEGWKEADYYFGGVNDGAMKTAWQKISVYGGWKDPDGYADYFFYLTESGDDIGKKKTGWFEDKDGTCYLGDDGAMRSGLTEIDGTLYCLDENGYLQTSTTITADGVTYIVDENGVAVPEENPSALMITRQPENAEGEIGEIVSHTVEAENATGYTWYYSSDQGETWKLLKTWEGYNTATLSYELTDTRLNYLFHCVVTGENGASVTTDAVCAVKVVRGVTITAQPENAEGEIGETVSHTVEADNVTGYTWYYSSDQGETWKLLKTWEGYNTATLSYELTDARLNYLFRCVVTGKNGTSATTDAVQAVKIVRGVTITAQPENAEGEIGETVSHTVEADNATGYTWYYSSDQGETWKILKTWEGYNTATLSYELTEARLNYLFRCVVTGKNGTSETTDAVQAVKIVRGVVITAQPENAEGRIGETVSHTVEAEYATGYTWYYSSDQGATWKLLKTWEGYNTATLSYELTEARLNYLFRCVVTGKNGTSATTDAVYAVKTEEGLSIIEQPQNASGAIGDTITYTVKANNAASYTWYYSSDQGTTWKLLKTWPGYDTDTLEYEMTSNRAGYWFHCVVKGTDGKTITTNTVYVEN